VVMRVVPIYPDTVLGVNYTWMYPQNVSVGIF
jgi:hypothetical protein